MVTRARSLAWAVRRRDALPPDALGRVLFYHRISDDSDELAVAPARFRHQMETLAGMGARGVDLVEAARRLRSGDVRGVVGISFDDAYRDVAEHAVPVLRQLGFSATMFVPTGIVDGRASFSARSGPPVLSWAEICALDAEGVLRMEAHSVTHPNLLRLDEESARREILDSRLELENRLGRPVTAFAYPAGLAEEREFALVREAGYEFGFTCEPGLNDADTDRFALHRTQIDARDSILDFRAKVGGGHDASLPLRAFYRRWRFGTA
jgi:peptidoglycan/xylan/chitin deacetylase (PgdA/CDA1 family)